jgi:hypothetical protein
VKAGTGSFGKKGQVIDVAYIRCSLSQNHGFSSLITSGLVIMSELSGYFADIMKSTILIFLLSSFGIAHPYRQHLQRHHKRQDVVWVTDYNYVTETIDVTTTIWVQGFVPLTISSYH